MRALLLLVLAAALFLGFGWCNHALEVAPYKAARYTVATPIPMQLILAGGDRYLAANINAFRVLTVGTTQLDPLTARVLGRLQYDTALLNPAHEDNYYTAAAILPWIGQVDPAQFVLEQAARARKNDIWPAFYLGFNRYYFLGDYVGAGQALALAATQTERQGEKNALLDMAGKWSERIDDPVLAQNAIRNLIGQSHDQGLKDYLAARMKRVEIVNSLRETARRFKREQGRDLSSIEELVQMGYLPALPEDPLQQGGYTVRNGLVLPVTRAN